VSFTGEYKDGIRFGKWMTKYKGEKMFIFVCILSGGGAYNEQGLKFGQWTELYQNFNLYHENKLVLAKLPSQENIEMELN
jgi:hypothetical protein